MDVKFNLNGCDVIYSIKPDETLAEVLRRNGIFSIKVGCNESMCGSCTVLLDDKPILSCSYLAIRVDGHRVTTVEGIPNEAKTISNFFVKEGASQCGYCTSGLAMIVYALKKEYKNPSEEEIKDFIVGNLCRCTGYQSQLKAIKNYLANGDK